MFLQIIKRKIRQRFYKFIKYTNPLFSRSYFQAIIFLICIALINFYSIATSHELITEFIIFALGTTMAVIISNIHYIDIKKIAIPAYLFVCSLLFIIPIIGVRVNGASRWIRVIGFTLQPSELLKLAIILIIGYYLQWRSVSNVKYNLIDLFIPFIITIIPIIAIIKQPDLGTSLICFMIVGAILLFIGIGRKTLIVIISTICIFGFVGWKHMKQYQKERVLTFINTTENYTGNSWQSHQSLIGFGSGGFLGKGIKNGPVTQLGYLPERQTDFAISSIGEEHGFVVVALILFLINFIVIRLLETARRARDRFSTIITIGVAFWIGIQAIINMCMIIGVIPIVGIPFPFMSYGGSSLFSLLIATGIIASLENN